MRDFTLIAYKKYLEAIKHSYPNILTMQELMSVEEQPSCFAVVRHDVDRLPQRALAMAKIEHLMGVRATYYFRDKRFSFNSDVIKKISLLGHDIGFHYESLVDAKGDIQRAYDFFGNSLEKLRKYAPVDTIAMHGRPFSRHDSKDMFLKLSWKSINDIFREYGIEGEAYLSVDYRFIAYISDTGRNWSSEKHNRRDKVESRVEVNIENGDTLYAALNRAEFPKLVLQIHPERWVDNLFLWAVQLGQDSLINLMKFLIIKFRPSR